MYTRTWPKHPPENIFEKRNGSKKSNKTAINNKLYRIYAKVCDRQTNNEHVIKMVHSRYHLSLTQNGCEKLCANAINYRSSFSRRIRIRHRHVIQ